MNMRTKVCKIASMAFLVSIFAIALTSMNGCAKMNAETFELDDLGGGSYAIVRTGDARGDEIEFSVEGERIRVPANTVNVLIDDHPHAMRDEDHWILCVPHIDDGR